MTDPLEAAIGLLDKISDTIAAEYAADTIRAGVQMKNDKRLVLVEWYLKAAAIKAATTGGDHPPVPEQAASVAERELIEDSAHLYDGWLPGAWPVLHTVDPRGFRWHVFGGR